MDKTTEALLMIGATLIIFATVIGPALCALWNAL